MHSHQNETILDHAKTLLSLSLEVPKPLKKQKKIQPTPEIKQEKNTGTDVPKDILAALPKGEITLLNEKGEVCNRYKKNLQIVIKRTDFVSNEAIAFDLDGTLIANNLSLQLKKVIIPHEEELIDTLIHAHEQGIAINLITLRKPHKERNSIGSPTLATYVIEEIEKKVAEKIKQKNINIAPFKFQTIIYTNKIYKTVSLCYLKEKYNANICLVDDNKINNIFNARVNNFEAFHVVSSEHVDSPKKLKNPALGGHLKKLNEYINSRKLKKEIFTDFFVLIHYLKNKNQYSEIKDSSPFTSQKKQAIINEVFENMQELNEWYKKTSLSVPQEDQELLTNSVSKQIVYYQSSISAITSSNEEKDLYFSLQNYYYDIDKKINALKIGSTEEKKSDIPHALNAHQRQVLEKLCHHIQNFFVNLLCMVIPKEAFALLKKELESLQHQENTNILEEKSVYQAPSLTLFSENIHSTSSSSPSRKRKQMASEISSENQTNQIKAEPITQHL